MVIGFLRPAFCRDVRLLGKGGTLQSPPDNLRLRWFVCADGRGVLSAGAEIAPAPCRVPIMAVSPDLSGYRRCEVKLHLDGYRVNQELRPICCRRFIVPLAYSVRRELS